MFLVQLVRYALQLALHLVVVENDGPLAHARRR
jgi:hypothetical protein